MNKIKAETLVEANPDLELYEGYSGRGMYGEQTWAVVYSNTNQFADAATEARVKLQGVRHDNLGLQFVAY